MFSNQPLIYSNIILLLMLKIKKIFCTLLFDGIIIFLPYFMLFFPLYKLMCFIIKEIPIGYYMIVIFCVGFFLRDPELIMCGICVLYFLMQFTKFLLQMAYTII